MDKDKQKKIVEDRSSAKTSVAALDAAERRRLADDADARSAALPSIRQHARQEYLTKRELQQVELLRKEIADEAELFRGMKVTKREMREHEHKKEVLRLVEERLRIDDKWDGYMLPEDYITEQGKIDKKRKQNVLYQRYEDAKPKDDQFVTDVDQWEASQTQHSTFKTGAMDKPELVEQFDYVFDESQMIQFVSLDKQEGTKMSAADKMLAQQIEEAEKRGKPFLRCFLAICADTNGPQWRLSRQLESLYLSTPSAKRFWTPSRSTKYSSFAPRLVQARPPSYHSTSMKRATLPAV